MVKFGDFADEKEKWITFVDTEFYPDYLESAMLDYKPTEERFSLFCASKEQEPTWVEKEFLDEYD